LTDGNYSQAIAKFKQVLQTEPDNNETHRDLGIAYYKSNEMTNAITSLEKSFALKNDDGLTIFYLGLTYESLPDYDKALNYYKKYINLGFFSGDIQNIIEGRIQWIANKKIENEIKAALLKESKIKPDTIKNNTIAVLYFQNIGSNKELDPLQKGLTEMLITDLSKIKILKVIERVKLQKLLQEIGLGKSGLVSSETAPRIGKIFGVGKLVKGTFLDLDSLNFRMSVGLIGTKSGSYKDLAKVTGKLDNLFKLEKELTFNVIDEMGIKITDDEREEIQIIPTESYLAFVAYCKGLDLEDQGKYGEAAEQYQKALSIDPYFNAAEEKAQQVEKTEAASADISQIENEIQPQMTSDAPTTIDRLSESSIQLTGETVTGQDDRSPANNTNFGRGVKVDIEILLPPNR
jgi:tetratricopeptide (TPR) repeat protein